FAQDGHVDCCDPLNESRGQLARWRSKVLLVEVPDGRLFFELGDLRVLGSKLLGYLSAPLFEAPLKRVQVVRYGARASAELRYRDAVERDAVDHVLDGIVLEPAKQDLALTVGSVLCRDLVEALKDRRNHGRLAGARRSLDHGDVWRVESYVERPLLHRSGRVLEDLLADESGEGLHLLRRAERSDLSLLLDQQTQLGVGRPALEYGLPCLEPALDLCALASHGQHEFAELGQVLGLEGQGLRLTVIAVNFEMLDPVLTPGRA